VVYVDFYFAEFSIHPKSGTAPASAGNLNWMSASV
jgi:hypothetical protein